MTEFISGHHAVFHVLRAGRRKVSRFYILKGQDSRDDLLKLAKDQKIPVQVESENFFQKNFRSHHQGVGVAVETYPYVDLEDLVSSSTVLVLDEIQDPQNVGALCRSAHLLGCEGVILAENRAAGIGPGASQASVGAVEYLKVARVTNIVKALEILKKNGFWIYGADHEANQAADEMKLEGKVALVIGSEEKGLRRLVRDHCDFLIKVPTLSGPVDSLNASVAGGILLYEIWRQRRRKQIKTNP